MKNAWHDIPPAQKWQDLIKHYKLPAEQTEQQQVLVSKIQDYHLIDKKSRSNIELRQTALNEIAQLAEQFVLLIPQSKDSGKWVNALQSLAKNAHQKAGYLSQLKEYLEKSKYLDKKALLERLGRDKNTPEVLRLYEGTLLERMDPAHRAFEFSSGDLTKRTFNNTAELLMNTAFFEWVKSEDTTPFFLWLEAHHLVTRPPRHLPSDPKSDFIERSVKYEVKEAANVICSAGQLLIVNENNTEPLNTDKLKNQSFKIGGRFGSAAFIWNNVHGENQFITHPHEGRKYHHSSLSQGKKVSCAGMWFVENGKIEEINNNSGHYRPTSLNFYLVIRELAAQGVMADHAEIADLRRVVSNKGAYFFGGTSSTYQPLPKYLAWAESLPEVKAYLNDKKMPFLSTPPGHPENDNKSGLSV